MASLLLAWSWDGHGQLTSLGLALALSWFIPLRKALVLSRLAKFAAFRRARETMAGRPAAAITEAIKKHMAEVDLHPLSAQATALVELLNDLPGRVQDQDLHAGNIPRIGEKLEKNGQVRHFMRSRPDVTPRQAFEDSAAYIRHHGIASWEHIRAAVVRKEAWADIFYDPSIGRFDDGVGELARALHTVQDSFAPGHARRREGTGVIELVHIWDEENKRPNETAHWPGHEALDEPDTPAARPFFWDARRATADVIFSILAHADDDRTAFLRDFDNRLANHFAYSPPK